MQPIRHLASLLLGACLLSACAAPFTPAATSMTNERAPTPAVATPEGAGADEAPTTASAAMPDSAATDSGDMAAAPQGEEAAADSGDMAAAPQSEEAAAVTRPAWQQIALIDARSGSSFTLADFAGKTVFVEPFATWCSNCRQQLENVQAAKATLGEDVVFVVLSVEPNIGVDALARYADDAGFDMTFAAMPPELLQALAAQFGQTVANPPATPHFVIRPDGSTTDLVTGIESPEAIQAQIDAARG